MAERELKQMLEKNKELILNLLIILFFGAIITISYSNSSTLNYDIIWLFHTSQKVSNGYVMYTEINTVLTPIFFWIGALFIKIFGNKILSMYIFSGLVGGTIIATLYNIMKKVSKNNSKILFLICSIFALRYVYIFGLPNYNTLAIMWWLLAVFLELKNLEISDCKKKLKNDFLIGILIGLTIFTKQNIGVFALISSVCCTILKKLFDKNELITKEILSKIIGTFIIEFGMLIYFIISDSFGSFIDYCIGGVFEFGDKNISFKISWKYMFCILLTILGIIISIKNQNKKMGILAITQICLIPIIYPISNAYHIILSMVTLFPLLMSITEYIKNNKISHFIIIVFLFLIMFISFSSANREYSEFEDVFMGGVMRGSEIITIAKVIALTLYANMVIFEKENWSKYVYMGSLAFILVMQIGIKITLNKNLDIPKNLYIYEDILYHEDVIEYIDNVVNYIKEKEKNGKKAIVVSADASYYTAPLQQNNYVYDFPLYGSLGFEGEERLINGLVDDKDIVILKNKYMMYQESKKLDEYIRKNYKKIDEIHDLEVFEKNK